MEFLNKINQYSTNNNNTQDDYFPDLSEQFNQLNIPEQMQVVPLSVPYEQPYNQSTYQEILSIGLFPNRVSDNFNQMNIQLNSNIDKELQTKISHKNYVSGNEISHKTKKERKRQLIKSSTKRCYTCRPRGKVKQHVIGKSICENFIFHHDLNNRPIILLTPIQHYTNICEFDQDVLKNMFNSIEVFCGFWNIKDYQVSYSNGLWKTNDHFHIKIKIPEEIAIKMRTDHFDRLKLEKIYKEQYNLN